MQKSCYSRFLTVLLFSLVVASCSKNTTDVDTANQATGPRAGSRWVYHLTIDETYSSASPVHYEADIEWVAADSTIDNNTWLVITVRNLSVSSTPRKLFALRSASGGWHCKILNTPKEGLWLASPANIGSFYNQTHPPAGDFACFSNLNYDVVTQVLDIKTLTTNAGIAWQNLFYAAFDVTSYNGDLRQTQFTWYQASGPLLIRNATTETNNASGQETRQLFELTSFNR